MGFVGVAKSGRTTIRGVRLEYELDRLSERKIIQAYQLLMPDKTWSISDGPEGSKEPAESVKDEVGGDLRTCFL
jgi:hypothetical protein